MENDAIKIVNEIVEDMIKDTNKIEKAVACISANMYGNLYRKKRLPNSLFTVKRILQENTINLCESSDDGRINSCIDEYEIIRILIEKMPNRIIKAKQRMWYDILIYDYQHGWLPVNIKTTTTLTSDNIGNLATCVYAYTNEQLDFHKTYQNNLLSKILIEKLNKKEYNYKNKKDYYFIIINKKNKKDIIINSINGLIELTPNINNLPYQVCWNKNRIFKNKHIIENIKMFLDAIQKPKRSWKESFFENIRKITS
jgi:hypothetical protein